MSHKDLEARSAYNKDYYAKNREQLRERQKAHYDANRERMIERARVYRETHEHRYRSHTLSRYGISVEQYDEMLARQGGVCAICGGTPGKKRLAVDHDHETDQVRGLLCVSCNTSLAFIESLLFEEAMVYLERTG